jgi:glutamyl-tRNA reductase
MAESAARHLRRAGVLEILVTNRTRDRAMALAEAVDGTVIDYERFHEALPEVDILLASSGATSFIVTVDEMRAAISKRRNRPMFLIDIAVPRNIEPSVNKLDNVFLYDIDDLGKVVDTNLRGRLEVAQQAEVIIGEEVARMMTRLKTRESSSIIVSIREQVEQWRVGEIERRRAKLGTLTPQQEEALEAITRGLTNKFLHEMITKVKKGDGD